MASRTVVVSINSSWNFINFRAGLIRALVSKGYDVVAVAPADTYSSRLAELGCRFEPMPMDSRGKSPLADATLLLRYRRVLARERPLAFLGYTIKPNIYGSLAAHWLRIPVINNIAGLGVTFLGRGWLNRLVRSLYRAALRQSRVVFFQNPDDRDVFVRDRLVDPAVARLLPGSGIDLSRFTASPFSGRRDTFDFLMVARLLWAKGVQDYVDAARLVKKQYPDARFRLLGILEEGRKGAVDRAALEEWGREGEIEYLGAADDVRPFLAHADCVVLPTYYPEGTPRALLEAAAIGKPLITTDIPGCRSIVSDGHNGILVPPKDPERLARAMVELIEMPIERRAAMGAASRSKAEQEFDERIVIDAYLQALDEIGAA